MYLGVRYGPEFAGGGWQAVQRMDVRDGGTSVLADLLCEISLNLVFALSHGRARYTDWIPAIDAIAEGLFEAADRHRIHDRRG